ncbi:guanine nucleotide binding protein, alpha subunit, partial [Obelidium mucronatum]
MGNLCGSATQEVQEAKMLKQNTAIIDQELESEKKRLKDVVKLLLLGPGESGKSTILKQFRILYGGGFSERDRAAFRTMTIANIVQSIKTLITQMEILEIPYGFNPNDHTESSIMGTTASRLILNETPDQHVASPPAPFGLAPSPSQMSLHTKKVGSVMSLFQGLKNQTAPRLPDIPVVQNIVPSSTLSAAQIPGLSVNQLHNANTSHQSVATSSVFKKISRIAQIALRQYRHQMESNSSNAIDSNIMKALEIIEEMQIDAGFLGSEEVDQNVIDAIKAVWKDPGIQYCYSRSNEFQLIDTCAYFLDDIERFFTPEYIPTDQDILNCRIMTLTITESRFQVKKYEYRIYDVGGQRSERNKWAAYFEDVAAIMFVVAVSAFDQVCFEDGETNRITEALNVFSSICNHPLFKETSVLLFLNKIDLLKAKLERGALVSDYFPEYVVPQTTSSHSSSEFKGVCVFFSQKFEQLNKYKQQKKVYTYC